jgi:hypothetical protein
MRLSNAVRSFCWRDVTTNHGISNSPVLKCSSSPGSRRFPRFSSTYFLGSGLWSYVTAPQLSHSMSRCRIQIVLVVKLFGSLNSPFNKLSRSSFQCPCCDALSRRSASRLRAKISARRYIRLRFSTGFLSRTSSFNLLSTRITIYYPFQNPPHPPRRR